MEVKGLKEGIIVMDNVGELVTNLLQLVRASGKRRHWSKSPARDLEEDNELDIVVTCD